MEAGLLRRSGGADEERRLRHRHDPGRPDPGGRRPVRQAVRARIGLLPAALGLAGCASIHSFEAARELNPASVVALSGSFGSTWDKRRPATGGDNTWHNERVLVPDAQVNIRIKLDPSTDLNLDPLPPGVGGGLSFHFRPQEEAVPGVTFSPSVSYLVLPPQDVWSAELPLAFSWRAGPRWV